LRACLVLFLSRTENLFLELAEPLPLPEVERDLSVKGLFQEGKGKSFAGDQKIGKHVLGYSQLLLPVSNVAEQQQLFDNVDLGRQLHLEDVDKGHKIL